MVKKAICGLFPFRKFFTARVYVKLLNNDSYGRISIMHFFNYVMRKGQDHHAIFCNFISLSLVCLAGCFPTRPRMPLVSVLCPSMAPSDPDRTESVRCSWARLPPRVCKHFNQNHKQPGRNQFSQKVLNKKQKYLNSLNLV